MGVGLEVDLAAATVRHVRVALCRSEVRVPEHLLDGAEVGAAFEQVRGERMAEEMRVDSPGLEAGSFRELAQNQEGARAGQRAAAGVQEELGSVPAVEVGAAESEVAAYGLCSRTPEGYQALLVPFAENADDPLFGHDATLRESDSLGHSEACAVEELDEGAIAKRARSRAGRRVDEAFGLGRRQCARKRSRAPR